MKKSTYSKLFKASLATTIATGAFVAAVPTFAQAEAAKEITFKDVTNTYPFYEAIKGLTTRGVINGYGDGTYKPGQQISREHAAKIMALALNLDTKNVVDPGFKDVKKGHPFYGHIAALVQAGIISGYGDDTFKPKGTLTRAHIAKMLVLGYKLEEVKQSNLPFKDVNSIQRPYIQTLYTNSITSGTSATTFSPNAFVTRGQVAQLIYNSEAVKKKGSEVLSITGDKVVLSNGTFTLDASLKAIFSANNLDFLKGAIVQYTAKDGVITGVSSIEIKASGTAEKNLVIDGQGLVFPGNLTINGDYIHLKNITIKGDFEIGKDVKNSFTGEKVIVEGTTKVSNKAATTATAQNGVRYSAAATEPTPTVIFIDATFANVEVTKDGIIIEYKGSTTVREFILSSNIVLKAAAGITIPKVTIRAGVTNVTLDANVGNLEVNTTGNLTLAGTGNIKEVTIVSNKDVKFQTTGKVDKLSVKSKDTHITLGTTKVGDLILPTGTAAKDIVSDFDTAKGNIEEINDVKNPDGTPAPTPTPTPTAEETFESAVQAKLTAAAVNNKDLGAKVVFTTSINKVDVNISKPANSSMDLVGTGLVEAFVSISGVTKATFNGQTIMTSDSMSDIRTKALTAVNNAATLGQLPASIDVVVTLTGGQELTYKVYFNQP